MTIMKEFHDRRAFDIYGVSKMTERLAIDT